MKKMTGLKKWWTAGVTVLIGAMLFAAPAAAATGVNVTAHSKADIRSYIAANGPESTAVTYAVEPVTTAPYAPGKLSDETQLNALKQLNVIRYIAGLNDNVTLDASYSEMVQAGVLINAVNNQYSSGPIELSHKPAKPADMDNALYQLGYTGAKKSNLAWNYRTLVDAVNGWMGDDDDDNIEVVGHRRWMLNPPMSKAGFGKVGAYSAIYAHDSSGSGNETGVTWPAQMMPVDLFPASYPWSISMGSSVPSTVRVTLKRRFDNKEWSFYAGTEDGYFNVNNDYFGQPGCIIFRPKDAGRYYNGDIFDVTITGLSSPVSYTVEFFSMEEMTSLSYPKESYAIPVDSTYSYIRPASEPSIAILENRITYESSDPEIAKVDENGYITGVKRGRATITAHAAGLAASCEILVTESIAGGEITFANPEAICYQGGSDVEPDPVVTFGDETLTKDTDYEIYYYSSNWSVSTESRPASVTIKGKGLFTGTLSGNFMILPADIANIEASLPDELDYTYSGSEYKPSSYLYLEATYFGNDVYSSSYTVSYEDNINAGTAYMVLTGKGNYVGTKKVPFTIKPRELTGSSSVRGSLAGSAFTYTGGEICPEETISWSGTALVRDTDYTVAYENNVNVPESAEAAQPAAVITGKGNYAGTVKLPFAINPVALTDAMLSELSDETYTGAALEPAVTVTWSEKVLEEGTDYTLAYEDNVDAKEKSGKSAGAVVTGKGNFAGTARALFTITPASLADATVSIEDATYTGDLIEQPAEVLFGKTPLTEDEDFTVSYTDNLNAGTAQAVLTGKGNFTGSVSKAFEILKASVAGAEITVPDVVYTGSEVEPALQVTLGGRALIPDEDYTAVYMSNTQVGTATVTISGVNNYKDAASETFAITKADLADVSLDEMAPVIYTGEAFTPVPVLTWYGAALEKDADFTLAYEDNTDAGTARVTVTSTADSSFKGTRTLTFSILPCPVNTAQVTVGDGGVYDGSEHRADVAVAMKGAPLAEGTDYSLTYTNATNAGTATVRIEGAGNYSGLVTKQYVLRPADLSEAVLGEIQDQTYTGKAIKPAVTLTFDGKALVQDTDFTLSGTDNVNVGTASVKAAGIGNYTGETAAATFAILPRNIAEAAAEKIADQLYTGQALEPAVSLAYDGKKLAAGTDFEVTAYENNTATGTASVTVEGRNNFGGSKTLTFNILEKLPEEEKKNDPAAPAGQAVTGPEGAEGALPSAAAVKTALLAGPASMTDKNDPAGSTFGLLQLKFKKATKSAITISWKKVPGAARYTVYGNACGTKMRELKTVTGASFTEKKLKKGKYYKYLVIAETEDGKAAAISKVVHIATKGGKVGNDKSVKITSKKTLKLKAGKSAKIKAKAVPASSKLKVKKHRKLKYESSDPSKATVSAAGKVTAKAKGSCTIYVYAQDGVSAKVKVIVS